MASIKNDELQTLTITFDIFSFHFSPQIKRQFCFTSFNYQLQLIVKSGSGSMAVPLFYLLHSIEKNIVQ